MGVMSILGFFTATAGLWCLDFSLRIAVSNIRPMEGTVRVALYNRADLFMKQPFRLQEVKAEKEVCIITFANLPNGEYACSIFHDVNDNGILDTGPFGIPREPWGFSNNARGRFGPPDFEAAKFRVTDNAQIAVQLNR